MVAKWGRSLAKRTESCLPVEGTRRRTPRFPPSCESSTFLRGHGEICRAETIGERQSGYSTVHFVKYSQFTDRLLLHRWFTLRRARHNSAAQLVYTLLRLSPTNKAADKRYLAGSEISPFTEQNHSQNDCGLRKMFGSDVETEQNNIAVLHHILLALGANQTLFAGSSQRAKL